jgi:glycosyltransferase involved in cell wall biosynthesis
VSSVQYDEQQISKHLAPLVSVVMAIHDSVNIEYLKKSINSILNQTLTSKELFFILDGVCSHDKIDYLENIKSKYSGIYIFHLDENRGPAMARNLAIKNSKAKYIAVMDSDDISLPNRLEVEVEFMEKNRDVSVVGSACQVINEDDEVTGYRFLPDTPKKLLNYAPFFCPLNNPTILARSEIFLNFKYKNEYRYGEDHRLWLEILAAGYKIANINEPLLKYRVCSNLYKRRVGYHKAKTDFLNRMYALIITPYYKMPFVITFAVLIALTRFLPHSFVRFFTTSLDKFREKYKLL